MNKFDLVVIGSGPSGQAGAIAASKKGKRVALIEDSPGMIGGVCVHRGTIPSKGLRETILRFSGYGTRDIFSGGSKMISKIPFAEIKSRLNDIIQNEANTIHGHLKRNEIQIFHGDGKFLDANRVQSGNEIVTGEKFLIATGTKPARPEHIPFDGTTILDSDEILGIEKVPHSMTVIGGGVIGLEYAIMFAVLGVKVTVIDNRSTLLGFCDHQIVENLVYHGRLLDISFKLGESVKSIQKMKSGRAVVQLESHRRIISDMVLFSVGRTGCTDVLEGIKDDVELDNRGKIVCDECYQTTASHIYAVGDVIGFPSLASVSKEQGRRAVCNMYGEHYTAPKTIPYGLYTLPEISMVGETEEQVKQRGVNYEVGVADFDELAKAYILGCADGMLKLIFDKDTLEILGVHCIGDSATEIIHIGMIAMDLGATVDYFHRTVFNHPSIAEAYKMAANNGLNKLRNQPAKTAAIPVMPISNESISSASQVPS